ncbi:MAG: DUF2298 domain-containing protein, partial [Ilumatobacteraceae bacterium]
MTEPIDDRATLVHRWWWGLLALIVLVGFVGRAWNLDFDQGQHLHPDERFWALTSAELERQPPTDQHETLFGPALDWLDGDRSPANPYRATESFVYGPVMLAASRATAGWLHRGVVDGDQPANAVANVVDAVGIPLIGDEGAPTFDAGYDVELIGRLLAALLDTLTIAVVGLIGRRLAGPMAGLTAAGFFASCVLAIQYAHFLGSEPLLGLCSALTVLAALHVDRSADVRRAATSGVLIGLAAGAAVAAKLTAIGLIVVPIVGCVALMVQHRRRSDVARLAAVLLGGAMTFRVLHPAAFEGLGVGLSDSFVADLGRVRAQNGADSPPSIQWADRTPVVQPLVWFFRFTLGPGIMLAVALGTISLVRQFRRRQRQDVALWPIAVVLASVAVPFLYISLTALPSGRYFIPLLPALCAVAAVGVTATWRWAGAKDGPARSFGQAVAITTIVLAALWGVAFVNGVYGEPHTRIRASEWIADNVEPGSVLSSQAWDDGLPLSLPGIDVGSYRFEQLVMVGTDTEEKVETVAQQLGDIDFVVESSPRLWGVVTRIPERFPSTIRFFAALDTGELGFERVETFTSGPSLGWFSIDDASAEEAFSIFDHPEVRIWKKVRTVEYQNMVETLDPVAAANALTVTAVDAHAGGLMLTDDEAAAMADGPTYADRFDLGGPAWAHVAGWFLLLEVFGLAAFILFLPLLRDLPDAGLGVGKTLGLVMLAFGLFVANTWLGVTLARPVVVAAATLLVAIAAVVSTRRWPELRRLLTTRRRTLIIVEAIGATAFGSMILLRASNPDLGHPFRGGEKPFELALLTSVMRTDSLPPYDSWFAGGVLNYYYGGYLLLLTPARILATAPTLVMNLGPAVFASCAAGAAVSLGAAATTAGRRCEHPGHRPVLAGVLSAFGVLALSSMAVFIQIWRWRSRDGLFDWWSLSRVIPDSGAITEFPAWSLLFADLHPHLMDICLVLTVGVIAIALYRHLVERHPGRAVATAATAGVLIGMVRATNTWDLPLVAGAIALTVIAAWRMGASRRVCAAAGFVAIVIVVGVWSPYTRRGLVFDSGFSRNIDRTPWSSWLEQFGLFFAVSLFIVIPALLGVFRRSRRMWWRVRFAHLVAIDLMLIGITAILLRSDAAVLVTAAGLAATTAWAAWSDRGAAGKRPPIGVGFLALG